MLAPEFGGLRPWEMELLTPVEEAKVERYRREREEG